MPYWASLRHDRARMRVGPGEDYQLAWVYQRKGLPVKVVRVMQGWRLVEDPDGARGWMQAISLTPEREAFVRGQETEMRENSDGSGRLMWRAARGVVGKLGDCSNAGWCRFDVDGRQGWVRIGDLWGAGTP